MHSAENDARCDGCGKRPCVCETVVLPSADYDAAPKWYVDYFLPFGYDVARLNQAWAGLSDAARDAYRKRIIPPGEGD